MEDLPCFAHGAILCPSWTHLYAVTQWEIHANLNCVPLGKETVKPGNKQAREGTATFLFRHSAERSHFIFSNTVCSRSTQLT